MEMTRIRQTSKALCIAVVVAMLCMALPPLRAYAADNNPLTLTVSQVFNSSSAGVDDEFTYRLEPDLPSNPMPSGSTADGLNFTIRGTASIPVGPIVFTQAGLYSYKIVQVVTEEQLGYTYDRHVYSIDVQVDFYLDVSYVVYNMTREKTDVVQFINEFRPNPTVLGVMSNVPVVKTVSGNPSQNATFTFRLVTQDPANPLPSGSVGGIKEVSITGPGTTTFGNWIYEEEGVYYYTVFELNGGVAGYSYDTEVYTITDTVTLVEGQLVLSRVITNSANRQVTSYSFINTYSSTVPGPKTGDYLNTGLYTGLLIAGCMAAMGALIFLVVGTRRKEAGI